VPFTQPDGSLSFSQEPATYHVLSQMNPVHAKHPMSKGPTLLLWSHPRLLFN